MTDLMLCTIVIPVLNEQGTLSKQLASLQPLRDRGHEVIVVDGGSDDASAAIAIPYADKVLHSSKGRAKQMNLGAANAKHNWLLFLHVDTRLPASAMNSLQTVFASSSSTWGRFDVCLSGQHVLYRVIAWFMNKRSRLTGIATGDQSMFVFKPSFVDVGGFPDIALMEDIALSTRLRKISTPVCLTDVVITSNRRWREKGIVRTILFMWSLRLRYFFGENPCALAERYYRVSK